MRTTNDSALPNAVFDRALWTPLLELAAREVFEIMLGTSLQPSDAPDASDKGEFTALVGLAGSLCGVLSIRCHNQAAMVVPSGATSISLRRNSSTV